MKTGFNLFDPDDDGDGWNDTLEIECGTDSLNIISSPSDYDEDHICDPVDDFDDSPIVFFTLSQTDPHGWRGNGAT